MKCIHGCDAMMATCGCFELVPPTVTVMVCGPNTSCDHDWSKWEDRPDGVCTAVCAICGAAAIDEAMWD